MTVRIVEFSGDHPELVEGLCLHPDDPPRMLRVMTPYMEQRKAWLRRMVDRGLRVAIALGEDGEKRGLLEYVPIEWAAEPVNGEGSLFINCLWVLPRYWKTGVARALMEHVIARARDALDPLPSPPSPPSPPSSSSPPSSPLPASPSPPSSSPSPSPWPSQPPCGGVTLLGYERDKWFGYFPYMPVAFFKRWGFSEVDRDGSRVLLHLDLGGACRPSAPPDPGVGRPSVRPDLGGARRPSLIRPRTRRVVPGTPHVVEVLHSSQCPWSGWMIDGAVRALGQFDVEVRLVNTDERAVVQEYGLTRGVCVDGQPLIKRLASGREVARAVERYLGAPHDKDFPSRLR
ncbi:MAG: GNAT family N-acetyltransferase [Bacillota bacterium]|nr:GNAT family N-acetyltransferase [Bacillota bacterium]